MQELSINPDKLHTTELGAERIKRNLNLQIDDIVLWCKESVKQADIIIRWGKNFYVYRSGVAITINAKSNTIITAHPINSNVFLLFADVHQYVNGDYGQGEIHLEHG